MSKISFIFMAFVAVLSPAFGAKTTVLGPRWENNVDDSDPGKAGVPPAFGAKRKLGKKSKKDKDDEDEMEDFIEFGFNILDEIQKEVCGDDSLAASCSGIETINLLGQAQQLEALPHFLLLNFRAMSLAYPLVGAGRTDLFLLAIRVHRTLGHGNGMRIYGYSEEIVNQAYWEHFETLTLEDTSIPPPGDGIAEICSYLDAEFEQFKQHARNNYDATDLPPTPYFNIPGLLGQLCQSPAIGYIVRTDWKHHHAELIPSLMFSNCTRPIFLYTAWHWESLFLILFESNTQVAIQQLLESFLILLDYTNANGGMFSCAS